MHQYKIISYKDVDGRRMEAGFRYADSPAQALAYYDDYSNAKNEDGERLYSLVVIQTAVYKTVSIADFKNLYT